MNNLKNLMGADYHEGLTVEEINTFLGKGKFVNLNTGDYVAKEKFSRLETEKNDLKTKYDELETKTKDYDTLKTENDKFKGEKADADLKAKLTALGVNEKAFKYVKGDINDKTLVLGDDEKANKDAVAKYLKENPQFASKGVTNPNTRVIGVKGSPNGGTSVDENKAGTPESHATVNQNLRAAFGRKTEVVE